MSDDVSELGKRSYANRNKKKKKKIGIVKKRVLLRGYIVCAFGRRQFKATLSTLAKSALRARIMGQPKGVSWFGPEYLHGIVLVVLFVVGELHDPVAALPNHSLEIK